jgi:DNA-binding beta-propeller fold protein YncE
MSPPEPPEGRPPLLGLETVQVTTLVGYTRPGFADGRGWDARFNGPAGVAVGPDGFLYVSDSRNHRIRRVTPEGEATTVAGSGPVDCLPGGFADGAADQARLFNPAGIVVGPDGTVYFADTGNHRVRALRDGIITTVAGGPTRADELGFETGGYADGPAPQARFRFPAGLALTPEWDILVADVGNGAVRRIGRDGTVSTLSRGQGLVAPTSLAALTGSSQTLVVADAEAAALFQIAQRGGPDRLPLGGTAPKRPTAVCALRDGRLAVADAEWHTIWGREPSGDWVLLAGMVAMGPSPGSADGNGAEARFAGPCALAAVGNTVYVADFGNNGIRVVQVPPVWSVPPPEPRRGPRPGAGPWRRRGGEDTAYPGGGPYPGFPEGR